MTAPQIAFRDSLLELLDGDPSLPELHGTASAGQPQTLWPTLPAAGLGSSPVMGWCGALVVEADTAGVRAGSTSSNEILTVDVMVDVVAYGTGGTGDTQAAQDESVDLATRIVTVIRQAAGARRDWSTGKSSRFTRITRVETDPPVPLTDGGAGCMSQITVQHDYRSIT